MTRDTGFCHNSVIQDFIGPECCIRRVAGVTLFDRRDVGSRLSEGEIVVMAFVT